MNLADLTFGSDEMEPTTCTQKFDQTIKYFISAGLSISQIFFAINFMLMDLQIDDPRKKPSESYIRGQIHKLKKQALVKHQEKKGM